MGKRVEDYHPKGLALWLSGHRWYSSADIDTIIATVPGGLQAGSVDMMIWLPDDYDLDPAVRICPAQIGFLPPPTIEPEVRPVDRRLALHHKLEGAAEWLALAKEQKAKPPPSEVVKRLGIIESAAEALLEALWLPDCEDPSAIPAILRDAMIDAGGPDVDDCIRSVLRLREIAMGARKKSSLDINTDKNRHAGKPELLYFYKDLHHIWVDICGQRWGVSTDVEGNVSGPLIRFVSACLDPLGRRCDPSTIRDWVRKVKSTRHAGLIPTTPRV